MLFAKRKIPCYVLVFDQIEIIRKTLDFLTKHADRLDIVILENPSKNSTEIKGIISTFGQQKLIRRHYIFDKNITGSAFTAAITRERYKIKKNEYVIITDGDITSKDAGWLDEEISILDKNRDVFACGISLDMSNLPLTNFPEATDWIPADKCSQEDYYEVYTGAHLLILRSKELIQFMHWKVKQDLPFVDGILHRYCTEEVSKKWARTKTAKGYHLTWDLYFDMDHPYTKFKMSKTFQKTWYHDRTSPYTLIEY